MIAAALDIAPRTCPDEPAGHVAAKASAALLAELRTFPKPGLVSPVDRGSHADMDAATFRASAAALEPFFARLVVAGTAAHPTMDRLRPIGIEAEQAMLAATGGVNTHRGAIFALGLLCAARGAAWRGAMPADADTLCAIVRHRWGAAILGTPQRRGSHGATACARYGAGGARIEAARGFPHARELGLPALRHARRIAPDEPDAANVQAFFALLARLDDTNLLHRGGSAGLHFAQERGAAFLRDGGVARPDWRERAEEIHHAFVARRLSPGGSADLLAVTLFLDSLAAHR